MARRKNDFLDQFDFLGYFRDHAKLRGMSEVVNDEVSCFCPFHDDRNKPSFSANVTNGNWYCFAGCQGGGFVQFHAKLRNCTQEEATDELEVIAGVRRTVPEAEVEDANRRLLGAQSLLDQVRQQRGLTDETIRKYRLGYGEGRVWMPITERGITWNVKKHDLTGRAAAKSVSWDVGTGENRLFPYSNLKGDGPVYIMGGELKALLADQLGLRAVSPTAGEGNWRARFNSYFEGQDVVVCYDIDDGGRKGARQVAAHLAPVAKSVKVVELPITTPANGDFADYVLLHHHTIQDFLQLVESTPIFTAPSEAPHQQVPLDPVDCTLGEAANKEMYYKKVRFNCVVSGKDLTPFHAPKKVTLSCNRDQGDLCDDCGLNFARGRKTVEFQPLSQDVLHMIRVHDSKQRGFIRAKAGVPQRCQAWDMVKEEVFLVEELRAIPEVDFQADDHEFDSRVVFSVAGMRVQPNRSYRVVGITVPEPNTQYVTQVLSEMEPVKTSVDSFRMDPELEGQLGVFRQRDGQTVREKIAEVCRDLSSNVTRIWQRDDLLQALLTVYCSVLRFDFNGKPVNKGWMELLVVGDTRTGKSDTVKSLIRHIRLGELVTGENTSFAGLVGGMSQEQKRWHITWGKMPLNNRGLLAVDEFQGLTTEVIAALSGIRSSGVAEITKIQTERTEAQTRLVALSNPRFNKKMEDYSYGVHAVKELVGAPEDVARFDLAVVSASGEVDMKVINSRTSAKVDHVHTTDLLNRLVLWAWSRKSDQVQFDDDAVDEVLEQSRVMGEKYSSVVPLVEPAEQRIKIARAAVATACVVFSTNGSPEKVLVKRDHVLEASRFMQQCFDKPSMGYDLLSNSFNRSTKMDQRTADRVRGQFVGFENWRTLRESLLNNHRFRKRDLQDQIGYQEDEARILFRWMGSNGLVSNTTSGFQKQPVFTRLLRSIDPEDPPKPIKLDQKEDEI